MTNQPKLRLTARIAIAFMLALMAVTAFSSNASATDVGDGKLSCNPGEICLSMHYPDATYQRHFWHEGPTDGKFVNINNGQFSNTDVVNNASSVWNRDSTCQVAIVDTKYWGWYYKWIPRNGGFQFLADYNDMNDRIKRCHA